MAKHFIEYKIERDDVVVTVVTATADDDDELIFGWGRLSEGTLQM